MALIRWRPFLKPFEEMDDFFEDFRLPMRLGEMEGFTPAIDVYQTKDKVVVETPLPKIDPEKVDISIENDILTIKGETEKRTEVEEKNYYRKEVRHGSFYRSLALPVKVIAEKATATYDKGILKIEVPKTPEIKGRTIKVKAIKGK
ncbi:MAG: molecular chaperone [Parcubacteria group bacterium CG_4_10_14_0_8_um_filter_35_7]|nr:MAG: molecular chaperone [Parcubacteria group bacterium CG23_combo_of_CG06-09_8_20_14_all_35_9]PIY78625.1 MAG: molecular chaperone [Parcubacteria group bacterium CG_4_10_14_0_8_um_filter_35_7]